MKRIIFVLAIGFSTMAMAQQPNSYKSAPIKDQNGRTVGSQTGYNSISGPVTSYYLRGGQRYTVRTPATGSLSSRYGKSAGQSNTSSKSTVNSKK